MSSLIAGRQLVVRSEYKWLRCRSSELKFLRPLEGLLSEYIELFVDNDVDTISRVNLDGLILIRVAINHFELMIAWSDFRVNGGSFSLASANRFNQFLLYADQRSTPLIFAINTMGLRFMEGRSIFSAVFSMITYLKSFSESNLLITFAFGNCLGIGALLFGLGHYRIASDSASTLNLTGPDVFALFFGKKVDFNNVASTNAQFTKTDLIHELVHSKDEFILKVINILGFNSNGKFLEPTFDRLKQKKHKNERVNKLLVNCADTATELLPNFDDKVFIFLVVLAGKRYGLMLNPLGHSNNMITARTITAYSFALRFFAQLGLPVLSLLDTPGADPRECPVNQHIIEKLISISADIINYPFRKVGIGIGRVFGGATVLSFPKVFGASANYILSSAQSGVMDPTIIEKLLSGSASLKAQWQKSHKRETSDFKDLLSNGTFDGVIEMSELRSTIKKSLLQIH